MEKGRPPKPGFSEFKYFIRDLFKRRVLVVSLLAGILVASIQVVIPVFSFSVVIGLCIMFTGFLGAAFLEHHDLLRKYQMSVVTVPVERNNQSGITVSFAIGNEYQYSIADPYERQNAHLALMEKNKAMKCRFDERGRFFINDEVYYSMARGGLEINFQLYNSGDVSLDILSIYVDDNLELNHLRIYLDGIFLHGGKVKFPLRLEKGEFITLQSRHHISFGRDSTDALFAADMRILPANILYDVIVNTSNKNGKRQSYVAELATHSKDLVDLYQKQWQEFDQMEYLVLSGMRSVGDG